MNIDKFLKEHGKRLRQREWFFAVDNNTCKREDWDDATFRMLVCFLSPGGTRAVSSTATSIQNIVLTDIPGAFIDFAYFPSQEDYEVFMEQKMPLWFGNVSHRPPKDYDLVGISQIVIGERFNIPAALHYSGIPMGHHKRMKDPDVPFIMMGGMAGLYSESSYGKFTDMDGDEDESLIDFTYIGQAEHNLKKVIDIIMKAKVDKISKFDTIKELVTGMKNIYFPLGYEVEYDGVRIVKNVRKYEWMPPFVFPNIDKVMNPDYNFDRKIIALDGQNVNSADILLSEGCSGSGSCNFCAEGWLMGPWRELQMATVKKLMHSVRKWAASYQVSFFSFNNNYYSTFKKLLAEGSKVFPKVSLITMRADEIGATGDTIAVAKLIGLKKISLAIEGMGPRIRNEILNKNLSYENLFNAVADVFRARLMEVKFPMILTGRETIEDMDMFLEELKELISYRESIGSNTSIRMNFTPLVHYDGTPMRFMERKTAIMSLKGMKTMNYFLEKVRELKVRTKFHGKQYGTFIEQMMLDGGRMVTKILVDHAVTRGLVWYSSWAINKYTPMVQDFQKLDLETLFTERDRENWIYPNHRIHSALHGAMLESEDKLLNGGEQNPYCVKTTANPTPKCHAGYFGKDKILEQADVDLTVPEGKVTYRESTVVAKIKHLPYDESRNFDNGKAKFIDNALHYGGCTFCLSGEEVKLRTKRPQDSSFTPDMIKESISTNIARQKIRMIFKRSSEWDFIAPASIKHIVMSRAMQTVEDLEPYYHSVNESNGYWAEKSDGKAWWSGFLVFDVSFNTPYDLEKLRNAIPEINEKIHIGKIVSFYELYDHKEKLRHTDLNFFVFNSKLPIGRFKSKIPLWDKTIKYYVKNMNDKVDLRKDESLRQPYVMGGGDGSIGVFALPFAYNPYFLISTILGIGFNKALENTDMINTLIGVEGDGVCKECGKESVIIDKINNKELSIGVDCYLKKLMGMVKKKY